MTQTVSLAEHLATIVAMQEALDEANSLRIVTAIVLVRAAGGKIVVPENLALQVSTTSYIQETHDPLTGDRVFETFEKPTDGAVH